jgi:hyperosmotically inducible protein
MKNKHLLRNFALGMTLALTSAALVAAPTTRRTLEDSVRHELVMLPYVGVFDDLSYNVAPDGTVTLFGYVVRPVTRSDAESAVKHLTGVTHVNNQIEVLPLSRFDDQIRFATLRSLAAMTPLNRYFMGTQPSIRIIVKNGNVTLDGLVNNDMDRNLASLMANGVSNVFSVTNNLETRITN